MSCFEIVKNVDSENVFILIMFNGYYYKVSRLISSYDRGSYSLHVFRLSNPLSKSDIRALSIYVKRNVHFRET